MKFILGRKLNMSQVFDDKGDRTPVTLIEAGPCFITQIKTKESDGYASVQIGFEKIKENKTGKSKMKKPFKCLREFRIKDSEYKEGDKIDVSIFKQGDLLDVSGISKGKGFAGGMKKWGFAGGPASHGSKHHRGVGSTGSRYPQRVIKGRKMPGRMGSERKTIKNLQVIKIDLENNLLAVKGSLPGRRGTLLEVRGIL